jgi:hypothetical protein
MPGTHKKTASTGGIPFSLIGARGRTRTGTAVTGRRILSPLRLPVPPPGHRMWNTKMEGGTGFEPVNGGFADRSVSTSPSALISASLIISQAPRRVKNCPWRLRRTTRVSFTALYSVKKSIEKGGYP